MNTAQKVIEKCGGFEATARITGRSISIVHRWTYPKDKSGTGGHIPYPSQVEILKAAKRGEVDVSPADFFPSEVMK